MAVSYSTGESKLSEIQPMILFKRVKLDEFVCQRAIKFLNG